MEKERKEINVSFGFFTFLSVMVICDTLINVLHILLDNEANKK